MYRLFLIGSFFYSFNVYSQTIDLSNDWKITIGDSAQWADRSFNDSQWKTIEHAGLFENTGFGEFKNFGWVRKKVRVPSSFKKNADKYGYFLLSAGNINDADQTFFNGKLIGQTGTMPPDGKAVNRGQRIYKVPASAILWDEDNQIAIRIFSNFHNGGFSGEHINIIFPDVHIFHPTQKPVAGYPGYKNRQWWEASVRPNVLYRANGKKTGCIILKLDLPKNALVLYNGKLIGETNSSGIDSFLVPGSLISWAKDEQILIGLRNREDLQDLLYSSPAFDNLTDNGFRFMQVLNCRVKKGSFSHNGPVRVSVKVLNSSNMDFTGSLTLMLITDIHHLQQKVSQNLHLYKLQSREVEFGLVPDFSGVYEVAYELKNKSTGHKITGSLLSGEK